MRDLSPGYSTAAVIVVLAHLGPPYMIPGDPPGAGNLPANLLGASAGRAFRSVALPLALPSVLAARSRTSPGLSPFVRHHVTMPGRYSFLLPEMPGGPRLLRNPDATTKV